MNISEFMKLLFKQGGPPLPAEYEDELVILECFGTEGLKIKDVEK